MIYCIVMETVSTPSMTKEELVEYVSRLQAPARDKLLRALSTEVNDTLTPKQCRFVNEYTTDLNIRRAASAAGLVSASHWWAVNRWPLAVREAVDRKLQQREAMSELKAAYIRDYIHSVLEFCPTDFFQPAPEGGWMVEQGQYGNLPKEVKRLIESVELRSIRGNVFLAVTFISKTTALAMAARYTLTEHIQHDVGTIPWDQIAKQLDATEASGQDAMELKILEVENAIKEAG